MAEVAANFYLRKVYCNICTLNFFNIFQSTNGFLRNHHHFRGQVYRNRISLSRTILFVVDRSLRWHYNSKIDCTWTNCIRNDETLNKVPNCFSVSNLSQIFAIEYSKCLIWFCQGKLKWKAQKSFPRRIAKREAVG